MTMAVFLPASDASMDDISYCSLWGKMSADASRVHESATDRSLAACHFADWQCHQICQRKEVLIGSDCQVLVNFGDGFAQGTQGRGNSAGQGSRSGVLAASAALCCGAQCGGMVHAERLDPGEHEFKVRGRRQQVCQACQHVCQGTGGHACCHCLHLSQGRRGSNTEFKQAAAHAKWPPSPPSCSSLQNFKTTQDCCCQTCYWYQSY